MHILVLAEQYWFCYEPNKSMYIVSIKDKYTWDLLVCSLWLNEQQLKYEIHQWVLHHKHRHYQILLFSIWLLAKDIQLKKIFNKFFTSSFFMTFSFFFMQNKLIKKLQKSPNSVLFEINWIFLGCSEESEEAALLVLLLVFVLWTFSCACTVLNRRWFKSSSWVSVPVMMSRVLDVSLLNTLEVSIVSKNKVFSSFRLVALKSEFSSCNFVFKSSCSINSE